MYFSLLALGDAAVLVAKRAHRGDEAAESHVRTPGHDRRPRRLLVVFGQLVHLLACGGLASLDGVPINLVEELLVPRRSLAPSPRDRSSS